MNTTNEEPKVKTCPLCGEKCPLSEFTHTFYCPQSEGLESEDFEECLECRNEASEEQRKAAGL